MEAFDIVFMDVRMPVMDGLEATRAIRALGGAWSRVPIVALTANAFPEDVRMCREAGMNDFVAKPIRKRLLVDKLAKIAQATAPAEAGSAAPAHAEPTPDAPDTEALIDRSVVAELCEEIGAEGANEILRVFLDETRERLALLAKLSAAGDRAAIEVEAHTLKGAAGALGFARVATLARALEHDARGAALFENNPFEDDNYDAQVERIGSAFHDSCREMDEHPLMGARAA
jgi:response regulator RpfG family c-di-GMP phosphodiesterase